MRAQRLRRKPLTLTLTLTQIVKEFIDVVGGGEFLFQFALPEMGAQVLNGLGKPVESHVEIIGIGQHNIAPDGIRAARESQRVAQAASGERERQTSLIGGLASDASERHRN